MDVLDAFGAGDDRALEERPVNLSKSWRLSRWAMFDSPGFVSLAELIGVAFGWGHSTFFVFASGS